MSKKHAMKYFNYWKLYCFCNSFNWIAFTGTKYMHKVGYKILYVLWETTLNNFIRPAYNIG